MSEKRGQDVGSRGQTRRWWPRANPRCQPLSFACDLLDQIDDPAAQLGVLDAHEGLGQREAIGGRQEVGDIGRRGRFGKSVVGLPRRVRRAVEEERHRHLQDVRDLLQAARADPVRALLVFLHLLKGQAERVAELLLTHAEHHPTHTHPRAHVLVRRIGRLLRHHVRTQLLRPSVLFVDAVIAHSSIPCAIRELHATVVTSEDTVKVAAKISFICSSLFRMIGRSRCGRATGSVDFEK